MKRYISAIALIVALGNLTGHAQTIKDKPRYLNEAIYMAPVDRSVANFKEGLIEGNSATLKINGKGMDLIEKNTDGTQRSIKKLADTNFLKTIRIEKNKAFKVVEQIGSFSVIEFWPLADASGKGFLATMASKLKKKEELSILDITKFRSNPQTDGLIATQDSISYDLTKTAFLVRTSALVSGSTEFENKLWGVNIGLLALPIKVRPIATESGQFDFTSGFSMGATVSLTFHHNFVSDMTYSLLAYAGASSYTADEGKIKEKRDDYNITAWSPAVGIMVEKKRIQLSLMAGIDFPPGNIQKNWVYRNKPWFALGIGLALFNIGNTNGTASGTNK